MLTASRTRRQKGHDSNSNRCNGFAGRVAGSVAEYSSTTRCFFPVVVEVEVVEVVDGRRRR